MRTSCSTTTSGFKTRFGPSILTTYVATASKCSGHVPASVSCVCNGVFCSRVCCCLCTCKQQSGSISHEEFRHTLETLGLDLSDAMFKKFVKMYDPQLTGNIDYTRFNHNVGSMIHPRDSGHLVLRRTRPSNDGRPSTADVVRNVEKKFAESALRGMRSVDELFRKLDTDHSGTVTTGEFVEALRHKGEAPTATRC